MATSKKEFSATDAQPVVLYALQAASSEIAYPIIANSNGSIVISSTIRALKGNQKTTLTTTASTVVCSSVASVFLDIYGVICTNTSATASVVRFRDDTTEKFAIGVPAGETRGFMVASQDAHKQAAVTKNWTALLDTAVASVEVTVLSVQNT